MMESWPYRSDLLKYAAAFERRRHTQLWRDDSLAKAEQMLFIGFLFVRKLIECRKVTNACANSSTSISKAKIHRTRKVSEFNRLDLFDDLDRVSWIDSKIDINQLADKVIHTWWIVPSSGESSGLEGFIFTTDRLRNSELWFLSTKSLVEVFTRFGNSRISQIKMERDELGKLTYWNAS